MKILYKRKIVEVIIKLVKDYGNKTEYTIDQVYKVIKLLKIRRKYCLYIYCLFLSKKDFMNIYGNDSDYDNCRKHVFENIFKIRNHEIVTNYIELLQIKNRELYGPNDPNNFKYTY